MSPSGLPLSRCAGLIASSPFLSERRYLPDFIVQADDGRDENDPLNLIVEIKGVRGEDAKEKANTIRTCWVLGINNLGKFGRWAVAEFRSVFNIDPDFDMLIQSFASHTK